MHPRVNLWSRREDIFQGRELLDCHLCLTIHSVSFPGNPYLQRNLLEPVPWVLLFLFETTVHWYNCLVQRERWKTNIQRMTNFPVLLAPIPARLQMALMSHWCKQHQVKKEHTWKVCPSIFCLFFFWIPKRNPAGCWNG